MLSISDIFRISKRGEQFSLATSAHTKGVKISFQNFSYGENFFLPKRGGHGPMPPKYATGFIDLLLAPLMVMVFMELLKGPLLILIKIYIINLSCLLSKSISGLMFVEDWSNIRIFCLSLILHWLLNN